jgi:lipoprotein-releasing system permease protein
LSFELFVALRYLRSKRKGLFSMVTTLIGVAGVAIGVCALIVILSVMNGFQSDIRKKIVGAQAHINVFARMTPERHARLKEAFTARPEIAAVAPFVMGQTIISFGERSTGIVLKGIDLAQEFKVSELEQSLTAGDWDEIAAPEKPGIVLGEELARSLGAWTGDEVILISPQGMSSGFGLAPVLKKFRVAGTLRTGYYEFDSATAYTTLKSAAGFFKTPGGLSGMQARLHNLDLADDTAAELEQALGFEFTVRSFTQLNRTLFAALRLEKVVMFIIVTLITLVASFNIASNLLLMSTEKLRDIGLLKAMGAGRKQIHRVFLWVGSIIGMSGVLLGTLGGLLLCWIVHRYPIYELPADVYYLSRLPVQVNPVEVLGVVLSGLLLSVLATLFPAARASKVDPIEAIHYG